MRLIGLSPKRGGGKKAKRYAQPGQQGTRKEFRKRKTRRKKRTRRRRGRPRRRLRRRTRRRRQKISTRRKALKNYKT